MDNPKTLFGQKLRILRKKKGWSQEELGFRSGLSRVYINQVERGRRNIALVNIYKLAETLEEEPEKLFMK